MTSLTLRLEGYAPNARHMVQGAQQLADERKQSEVEPLHLLYRLLERDSVSQEGFRRAGVDPVDALVEAEAQLRRIRRSNGAVAYLSPRLLDLLGRAEAEAARQRGQHVDVTHLLLALAQEMTGPVRDVFRACGLSAPVLRATLSGEDIRTQAATQTVGSTPAPASPRSNESDPLEQFGRDLTRMAAQDRFDPTVGRDAEMRRILQVLARRRESNPLLVGEPGIGKHAIVHGLAARMAKGDVPKMLQGKRLLALDMSTLVAGAKLRGQLEERMRTLLDAIRDSAGQVILFLDELGSISGEGPKAGAGDLLAAALGRGELQVIGVATPDELRKAFDAEATLARRFVAIPVEPPTIDEAVAILRGVVGRFEIAHGVRVSDPAINAAVNFARRYVPGVLLPKSAIDLIDEGAARVRVEMDSVPAELDRLERRLEALSVQRKSLEDDTDADSLYTSERLAREATELGPKIEAMRAEWNKEHGEVAELRRIKEELNAAKREHEQARASDDSARAGELRFGAIPLLEKQLEEAEKKLADGGVLLRDTVMPEDIADVVAAWTGIPVSRMLEEETEKLLKMEDRLRERVIGQERAVIAVSKAVRRGRVGLRDPRKPIGSFLFLGPTGVGKTELAKALAEFLFDDEHSLTRLDMSEFMEKHMVSRLLGSPPGYVDSDEGGFLTEAVRRRPYSVVLFDEMEKAHQDVFNILLQVLDDGRLTDSRGRIAHFADTVIIMTSNVGGHAILDHQGSPEELEEKVERELKKAFRPEFLNRIDDTVVFHQLTREHLRGIVEIQLRALGKLLAHRRIGIEVTDAAKDHLVELGYEPSFGARPLKRVILKNLQDPLAEVMLAGGYATGDTIRIDYNGSKFEFEKKPEVKAAPAEPSKPEATPAG
jgi:ATP-dependent Clp protease ATP-binding subunit ClpB